MWMRVNATGLSIILRSGLVPGEPEASSLDQELAPQKLSFLKHQGQQKNPSISVECRIDARMDLRQTFGETVEVRHESTTILPLRRFGSRIRGLCGFAFDSPCPDPACHAYRWNSLPRMQNVSPGCLVPSRAYLRSHLGTGVDGCASGMKDRWCLYYLFSANCRV